MTQFDESRPNAPSSILFLGDINFKGITASPDIFQDVEDELQDADLVFANLECSLSLGRAPSYRQAFCADPAFGAVMGRSGIDIVGNANNVNYGAEAILVSNQVLSEAGIHHVGAGTNLDEASQPVVIDRDRRRFGFIQKTAVYWPSGHAAEPGLPGVATIKAHTSYRPVLDHHAALTRPGVPPEVITWADQQSLRQIGDEIRLLRTKADVVIASFHWGYQREVLAYQREIAQAAIEAGADLVFGHGPHTIGHIERHLGKPIIYGMGNFVFHVAHTNDHHSNWLGMVAKVTFTAAEHPELKFAFVQKRENNRPAFTPYMGHLDEFRRLEALSEKSGYSLIPTEGDLWFSAMPIDEP